MLAAVAVVLGVGFLVAGCSRQAPAPGVEYARYQYSCCQAGLPTVAYPGQVIALGWTSTAQPPTASTAATAMTLSASVTGPFPDVAALKTAMSADIPPAPTVTAADVHTTDRVGGTPTSSLQLPAQAPSGFYDLRTTVASGGAALSGDRILQVAAGRPAPNGRRLFVTVHSLQCAASRRQPTVTLR